MLVIFRGLCGAWHRGPHTGEPTVSPVMWKRWLCKAWLLSSSRCAPFKAAIPDTWRHWLPPLPFLLVLGDISL